MTFPPRLQFLRVSALAKLNLGLKVFGVREDGYHEIETVLLPIDWQDILTYDESKSFSLTCTDASLPVDERNLVWRAAEALATASGVPFRGSVHLEKNVPYGAGLGSGSSDAAAALKMLREAWNLQLADDDLEEIAAGLGSDVPFFIEEVPAVARGRGEILKPIRGDGGEAYELPFSIYELPFSIVVAVPDVHISTADAYTWVSPRRETAADLAEVVLSNDLDRWRAELTNDFQEPVVQRHPDVARIILALEEAGAGYVSLSGSGSAVFGVFEDDEAANDTAAKLKEEGCRVWAE